VCCADESRGTRWDGQKNEGMARKTKSPSAEVVQPRFSRAGSTSSGELQTALLIGFQKQKREL